jgi:hypothetical protein
MRDGLEPAGDRDWNLTDNDLANLGVRAGLACAGACVVIGILLWVPAAIGARLQHGSWVRLSVVDLVGVGWHWLTHPADPLGGAPASVRDQLPDPHLFVVLVVVEVLLLLALAGTVLYLWQRDRQGRGGGRKGGGPPNERRIPGRQHV